MKPTIPELGGVPPNGQVICSVAIESTQSAIFHFNNTGFTNMSSGNWPTNNLAIFVPFTLTQPFLAKQMFAMNGATALGSVDVGIYASDGTRLVSMGSTLEAGTNGMQVYDITDTYLGAGQFYMAIAETLTTGTFFRVTLGSAQFWKTTGMAQMASAQPLPAVATFATVTNDYLPLFGITGRTFV